MPRLTRLTLRDLASAQVDARRYAKKHPDLAAHYGTRYSAMAAAFGADGSPQGDASDLEGLIESCVRALLDLHSPFSSYIEGNRRISSYHREYAPAINDGIKATKEATISWMASALAELWSIPADKSVPSSELLAHGFNGSPAPDPWDYF